MGEEGRKGRSLSVLPQRICTLQSLFKGKQHLSVPKILLLLIYYTLICPLLSSCLLSTFRFSSFLRIRVLRAEDLFV